jgi:hypothetical protein
MSARHRCNRCLLDDIHHFANRTGQSVDVVAGPIPEGFGDPVTNPDGSAAIGVTVLVGGSIAAWLLGVSEQCVCGWTAE